MEVPSKYIERLPYYFSHLTDDEIAELKIPAYAAYSVSAFDDAFENANLMHQLFPDLRRAVDFTACVGVDTVAMGFFFNEVTAYEVKGDAFAALQAHATLCKARYNQVCTYSLKNCSGEQHNATDGTVYVIDPEWGGPDYRKFKALRLRYGEYYCDDFVRRVLEHCDSSAALLKLPKNYDMASIQRSFRGYQIYTRRLRNQLFVVVSRRRFQVLSYFFDICLNSTRGLRQAIAQIYQNRTNRPGLNTAFYSFDQVAHCDAVVDALKQHRLFDERGFQCEANALRIGVVTGFIIPDTPHGPRCETDGPIGSVRLLIALMLNYKCQLTCFTEPGCEKVIAALLAYADARFPALGLAERVPIMTCKGPGEREKQGSNAAIDAFRAQDLLFFVEKVGPSSSGVPLSMRGLDCSKHVTPLYAEFSCRSVGIGDGGNEIGCGGIAFPGAEAIHCVVRTTSTVLGDTSNYGADLLARVLNFRHLGLFIQRALREADFLKAAVEAGAVDGVRADASESVDGLDADEYCRMVQLIFQ